MQHPADEYVPITRQPSTSESPPDERSPDPENCRYADQSLRNHGRTYAEFAWALIASKTIIYVIIACLIGYFNGTFPAAWICKSLGLKV